MSDDTIENRFLPTARANPDRSSPFSSDGLEIFFSVAEPKKEKTEQNANGAVSPSGEPEAHQGTATTGSVPVMAAPPSSGDQQKPSRPSTLNARILARGGLRILFDSEYSLLKQKKRKEIAHLLG